MPSVACISPQAMKGVLESNGYKLIDQDEFNWAFAVGENDVPIIVPHTVRLLPIPVMHDVMSAGGRPVRDGCMREALKVTAQDLAAAAADDGD